MNECDSKNVLRFTKKFKVSLFPLLFLCSLILLGSNDGNREIIIEDNTLYTAMSDTVYVSASVYDINKKVISRDFTREDFIKYYYNAFNKISNATGLSVAQLYAIIFYETCANTTLWTKFNNGACIKSYSNSYVEYYDDCGNVKCKFRKYPDQKSFFEDWIKVLNNRRYDNARNKSNKECFIALKRGGWHTDQSQYNRARTANKIDRIINEHLTNLKNKVDTRNKETSY